MTCRGSRFNPTLTTPGQNSPEWEAQNIRSTRNFIRKWGHFVKHDEYMKPIISHKYNIAFVMNNGNLQVLEALEPWCDRIYTEETFNIGRLQDYIEMEQSNTKFDLRKRVLIKDENDPYAENDIVVEFDTRYLTQGDVNMMYNLSDIISQTFKNAEDVQGEYHLGNLKVTVTCIETYEHDLIMLK
jgi:hypothetical protein